jgi:RNA polymerase sigma factor (sigma-70 family)
MSNQNGGLSVDKRISPEFSRLIARVVGSMNPSSDEEKALKQYIRLVLVIARKYVRQNVDYEDLIMCGIIGLIEAVRNFDPSRSNNFSAYAITRMKGRMYEFCISNLTSISVPTHVGKTKVYAERMTRMLDQEPYLFAHDISTNEIICTWEHPAENEINVKIKEEIRKIKGMVFKIANNSKTSYEELVKLAYKSMVTEIGGDEISEFAMCTSSNDIETEVEVREITEKLRETMGDKKTTILMLHHQNYNNEDIAEELFDQNLTSRRISRQAVRGLLKNAEKKAQRHVKTS